MTASQFVKQLCDLLFCAQLPHFCICDALKCAIQYNLLGSRDFLQKQLYVFYGFFFHVKLYLSSVSF